MLAVIIVVVTVLLDQASKALVVAKMGYEQETVKVIGDLLVFFRTENDGAAFGMLSNARWVFMLFSIVAIGIGIYCLVKYYYRHPLLTVSVSLLLGGGIGNMIDRLFRVGVEHERAVVDFLYSSLMPWFHFNLADAFITVGAVLLCVYMLFMEPKVEKAIKAKQEENGETQSTETEDNI